MPGTLTIWSVSEALVGRLGAAMRQRHVRRVAYFVVTVVLALSVLVGWTWQHERQPFVRLEPGGKAAFYPHGHGFFQNEKYSLTLWKGNWHTAGPDGGGDLLVPFRCNWNGYLEILLEDHGRVYLVDRRKLVREELRVVNGEWSRCVDGEWFSIFNDPMSS